MPRSGSKPCAAPKWLFEAAAGGTSEAGSRLVISYSYFWHSEHLEGREEGQKDRPCAIVAAIRADASGETRVLVLPVTHNPPKDASHAIEIPSSVKQRLNLDDARSWIVVSEWNKFVWPGPDLRRLPNSDDPSVAYGMLPPSLFEEIREALLAIVKTRATHSVRRT